MKSQTVFFILGSLFMSSLTQAFPLFKREIVYVTDVQDVYETVVVVTTVLAGFTPTVPTPTAAVTGNQQPTIQAFTSSIAQPTFSFAVPSLAPTVSLTSVAIPVPTSKPVESPVPSSASLPASSTAPAPVPQASSDSVASNGITSGMAVAGTSYTGDLTWYSVGLGSCGQMSQPSDTIVAVSHVIMDAYNTGNPNDNPLCNKKVNISYNGQTYPATVVDTCEGCAEGSLDLSEDFFTTISGNPGIGRVHNVQWEWA